MTNENANKNDTMLISEKLIKESAVVGIGEPGTSRTFTNKAPSHTKRHKQSTKEDARPENQVIL